MRRLVALCALACALFVAVPGAQAKGGNAVIKDCSSHGQLTRTYTLAQLRHADAILPANVKQYTNCGDIINQAILAATHHTGNGTGGGSGGSFLPTPVIVILIILILAAVIFGALAIRRRRAGTTGDGLGDDTRVMGTGDETRVMGSEPREEPPGGPAAS